MRFFACVCLLSACGSSSVTPDAGTPIDSGGDAGSGSMVDANAMLDAGLDAERPPPGALTYLEDIHPMFEAAGCSTFACHGSMVGAGTLVYMPSPRIAYLDMIDRPSARVSNVIVRPRDPEASVLVEHADTTLIDNSILDSTQAMRVRQWVLDGAFYSRSGVIPETDAGAPDGGVLPSGACSFEGFGSARGWPALVSACLPRCTRSTWDTVIACRTAADVVTCQQTAIDADTTPGVTIDASLDPIDCDGCLDWQTNSCIEELCRFELLAAARCLTFQPGASCAEQNGALVACEEARLSELTACRRAREALCPAP
jgi:hypothetical protein